MTTSNVYEKELARLTARREKVRAAIEQIYDENATQVAFEGRSLSRPSLVNLERREARLTRQINKIIARRNGGSYFDQRIVIEDALPFTEDC